MSGDRPLTNGEKALLKASGVQLARRGKEGEYVYSVKLGVDTDNEEWLDVPAEADARRIARAIIDTCIKAAAHGVTRMLKGEIEK